MIDSPETTASRIGVWVATVLAFIAAFFVSWVLAFIAVNWAIGPNCPKPRFGGQGFTGDMCGLTEGMISIAVGFLVAIIVGIAVARAMYRGSDPSHPDYKRPL